MLRNFLYLNERSLNSYLSVFEDGTRGEVKATIKNTSSKGGALKIAMASGKIDKGTQVAESSSREDTPSARFDRLRSFALESDDSTNWLIIEDNPDELLKQVPRGTMIEVQCETYIPDTIKAMSSLGSVNELFEQIDGMRSIASSLNLDPSGLPDSEQVKAIRGITGVSFDLIVIGEVNGSPTWRLKAKLQEDCIQGEVEGNVTIVGKVIETWPSKHWKPLLEMSGMNVIPREQRRIMEKTKPSDDQANNWLEGPAMTIELLAIYV